ncbi:hypothetical protein QBC37DRAFT_116267 [Rhypophila decipiens]|uniref:BZIP domain-containing protein n=1 Tax=Rhypophila decipiens TaxID=261697 RepID=A0AAN6XTR9_9PEZI|nr:hypothetical protein QBC37DRAFT_116267 [Rhypophila decipiens]
MTPQMSTENRPRTRQRKSKPAPVLEIPDIEENAAERKRLLNVLAQRRYRQRKRELRRDTASTSPSDNLSRHAHNAALPSESNSADDGTTSAASTEQYIDQAMHGRQFVHLGSDNGNMDSLLKAVESLPIDMANFMTDPQGSHSAPDINNDLLAAFDPPNPLFDTLYNTTPVTTPSLTHSPDSDPTSNSLVAACESFPDSYLLPMPELTLLRALLRIAVRLNAHAVWDMAANSPFNSSPDISWTCDLPAAWKPTPLQITTPHHPLIDLLPWPSVRDKMLSMLTLPSSSTTSCRAAELLSRGDVQHHQAEEGLPKPAVLQDCEDGVPPLVGFIYDMEDGAGGIRIWGDNPYQGDNWEVGQVVFQRWWFLFDRPVVERSNYLRRLRGADVLQCG